MLKEVHFVDTTFRDGHASLWAEGMTTGMMLSVASEMDRIGFKSMDFIATSHFLKCVREFRENPWERMRLVRQKIRNTPLSMMMLHSITAFDLTPFSLLKLWIERVAANGIKRIQFHDPSNDMSFRIPECVEYAKKAGLQIAQSLVYSYSPKHTDAYYKQKVHDAAKLGVDAIYLKDSGGLLTPERIKTLIPVFLENGEGIPIELHSHCTTGLAPLCYLDAVQLGIDTLHTSIAPLANGSSQPSVMNVADNLHVLGYETSLDMELVQKVSDRLTYIARKEGLPLGSPLEYDASQYRHQTPGGVISNLKHQLSQLGIQDRLDAVLGEVIHIREDFGYPIMVTPFSQFLVTQATMNVVTGQRYAQVIDELIKYALGFWGKEASSSIASNVKDKILSLPRARELAGWEVPQPSLKEVRRKFGGQGISDEELLLRFIVQDEEAIKKMKASGTPKEYPIASESLVAFLQELVQQKDLAEIHIQKDDFSLTLKKSPGQQ
jgi:oxaloacetate decarboxylase (Na+ extruding) subunit alpha